jgi:hypothetical protein
MNGAINTFAIRYKVWAEVWATKQPISRSTEKQELFGLYGGEGGTLRR